MQMKVRWNSTAQLFSLHFASPKNSSQRPFSEPQRYENRHERTSSLQCSALFPSLRARRLGTLGKGNKAAASETNVNYARKWHEAGSKRVKKQARKKHERGSKIVQTRLEIWTNGARKWNEPGSEMAQTRLERGSNQARKWHKQGSKMARTRHDKSTNQHEKSFNSSVLGSKLSTQNGSNQGTIKELMLHKWQATTCERPVRISIN